MSSNQVVFSKPRCAIKLPCTDALGAHQASQSLSLGLNSPPHWGSHVHRAAHPKTCLRHPPYDGHQKGMLWERN